MIRFGLFSAAFVALFLLASAKAEAEDTPRRGYLGLQYAYEETTEGQPEGRFRVRDVYSGGPAEKAGLQVNDLIVAVNGVTFRFDDVLDIYRAFFWIEPGDEVELSILRDGSPLTLRMIAGTEPLAIARARPEAERQRRRYRARLTLDRIAEGEGVEVTLVRDSDGFGGEIEGRGSEGLDSEIEQEIVTFVANKYLGTFQPKIQEGDRITIFFKAHPPEPGAEPNAPRKLDIRVLESPPHVWDKGSEEGDSKQDASDGP